MFFVRLILGHFSCQGGVQKAVRLFAPSAKCQGRKPLLPPELNVSSQGIALVIILGEW